jgi:hypothetical protein
LAVSVPDLSPFRDSGRGNFQPFGGVFSVHGLVGVNLNKSLRVNERLRTFPATHRPRSAQNGDLCMFCDAGMEKAERCLIFHACPRLFRYRQKIPSSLFYRRKADRFREALSLEARACLRAS